jgi:hypothetical protein
MTPLQMIAEWRTGCTCADPANPVECQPCTDALINAIERALTPRVHKLKTDPGLYEDVQTGHKKHEIRFDDRDYRVGDILVLQQTSYTGEQMRLEPHACPLRYTGEEMRVKVTHVLRGYGLQPGWIVMSIEVQS